MAILDTILNAIFPAYCLSCQKPGSYFCGECLARVPPAERESAEWVNPMFDYRHPPIKKAVWLIKYRGRKKIAATFAEALYGRILEELADLKVMENFVNPILLPIPISKQRLKERGFNQTELLCEEIMKIDQNKYLSLEKNILAKGKDTEHQARIKNRNERLKNLAGTFLIKSGENLQGRNCILIDDVTTTGATLSEARKVLKNYGARKVIAFTIAH